ncbi:molybdopterin molybdenumtransferase MoeA [Pseudodesulfovibrio sp. JC047]|uniref:molybdopterin molybdotransferase MoeA n=1 Tax=Pseudodesulfovibrio sp. JC047 TaxID=2683199 RepID=UPI0013CFD2DA|nr:molybdopterin molybdotransferase MoeA [Pseudodesulfovibrio sp. JC047]NDV18134.1 molybdopterin molybdenumtransferase MoeA [Pseudodesulfovibrio sp. JC047]
MKTPISRKQAVQTLLELVVPTPPEDRAPLNGIGCVTATTVTAHCQVPEQAHSLRDGYALRMADIEQASPATPVRLAVTQAICAESRNPRPLGPNETARVLTGGPVPDGADAVLAEEDVTIEATTIRVHSPVKKGWFIRPAGGEIDARTIISQPGHELTPQAAAVMTRTRTGPISMHPTPTARLFALGSELVDPTIHTDPKRFPADNLVLQRGLFEACGVTVTNATVIPDNKHTLISQLGTPPFPNIIVTTGGTGRSERDFAKTGAQDSGFTILFDAVDIRPGRHVFAAIRDTTILFGLPGPPAAGHACFHALILPVIRRLRGLPDTPAPLKARFTQQLEARHGSEWLVQCALSLHGSQLTATPLASKKVPPMLGLAQANGLAFLQGNTTILPGHEVEVATTLFEGGCLSPRPPIPLFS